MAKVQKSKGFNGCWLWTGATSDSGYGWFGVSGSGNTRSAHRVSYELHVGPIPNGLHVLHHCDVRHCVRPDHLWLGTRSDNMQDMLAKGRDWYLSGEDNGNTRVSDALVREIQRGDRPQVYFARKYGIPKATVSYCKNHRIVKELS